MLHGYEEHVSGWDLVYDNGYIEIDPGQCGYTSFLGAAVPEVEQMQPQSPSQGQGQGGTRPASSSGQTSARGSRRS